MPENTDTRTCPVTERIPHDGPWYTRPAAATFSRACAYGEGAYNCDGSTTEPTGDYGPTCECPCHDYWNGRDDLAAWHREYNTDKRFPVPCNLDTM